MWAPYTELGTSPGSETFTNFRCAICILEMLIQPLQWVHQIFSWMKRNSDWWCWISQFKALLCCWVWDIWEYIWGFIPSHSHPPLLLWFRGSEVSWKISTSAWYCAKESKGKSGCQSTGTKALWLIIFQLSIAIYYPRKQKDELHRIPFVPQDHWTAD